MNFVGLRICPRGDIREANALPCQTCHALLADYKDAVWLFKNVVHTYERAPREDSLLDAGRVVRWAQICKDASDALIEHWRQEHPRPAFAAKSGS